MFFNNMGYREREFWSVLPPCKGASFLAHARSSPGGAYQKQKILLLRVLEGGTSPLLEINQCFLKHQVIV